MKKIDNFTNIYKLSKTLRFKLIPVGKTKDNFEKHHILEEDENRNDNYKKAKKIIDKYYNQFIEKTLDEVNSNKFIEFVNEFYKLYIKKNKTDEEKKKLNVDITKKLRSEIVKCFENDKRFEVLFRGELVNIIAEDKNLQEDERKIIASFIGFTTYFANYFKNRENIFSNEEKVGSIAYRCIHENLPIFIDNIITFDKVKDILKDKLKELNKYIKVINYGCKVEDVFSLDYFGLCLTGKDISIYNTIVGGIKTEENVIEGLNQSINLYNQSNKDKKLPLLKPLYKQILQEEEKFSFVIDVFNKDENVYNAINNFINESDIEKINSDILSLLKEINNLNLNNIYINKNNITNISNKIYGNWSIIINSIKKNYDEIHNNEIGKKSYENNKKKYFDNKNEYSVYEIIECVIKYNNDINADFCKKMCEIFDEYNKKYIESLVEFNKISIEKENIKNNEKVIKIIKELLDSIKELYDYINCFNVTSLDVEKDEMFYSSISKYNELSSIVKLYNMTRNYVTKKPYSDDKIKLNFNSPTFLNGWDSNFNTKSALILRKDNKYFLLIVNSKLNFDEVEQLFFKSSNIIEKLNYIYQKPDFKNIPRLFIRSKGEKFAPAVEKYNLPVEKIIDIYDNKYYTTSYKKINSNIYKESLIKMIDYYKLGFSKHESYKMFKFNWKDSSAYNSIDEFYNDCITSCYVLLFEEINLEILNKYIDEGKLYLYQIYNKDFSSYSKGNKNLHTLYFLQLFDEKNLKNVVFKLNGEAEVFFRKSSLDYKVTHKKNVAIENKNSLNNKKTSIFSYDLVKDKRYCFDQIEFHTPITINFKSDDKPNSVLFNKIVNDAIKRCKNNYIIGIDRGERNLIYVVVIDESGKIVERQSMNIINNKYMETDYHALLDKKEGDRKEARKNWTKIENIKELKEGYVSQVVHKICELVEKYDAIIVMEDLNSGFKNTRAKVEKQVYQKFEKMLIDKLNFYVNKSKNPDECGGLRKAYQLTRPYEGNVKMHFQNGFIYYIAPWNTSKIDPTTGFVNLFRLANYSSIKERKEFFEKMDGILYNKKDDYFEFAFNYDNYTTIDYKKKWVICTYGNRLFTHKDAKNSNLYITDEVNLTKEYKNLFEKYDIDIMNDDIKDKILKQEDKKFFDKIFMLFNLTLQIRNSKPNTEIDYLISSVKNKDGKFYESEKADNMLPRNADENGAYNIARKGLMIVKRIKEDYTEKGLTVIKNEEWLKFAQNV